MLIRDIIYIRNSNKILCFDIFRNMIIQASKREKIDKYMNILICLYEAVSGFFSAVNKSPYTLMTHSKPNILVPKLSCLTQLSIHV